MLLKAGVYMIKKVLILLIPLLMLFGCENPSTIKADAQNNNDQPDNNTNNDAISYDYIGPTPFSEWSFESLGDNEDDVSNDIDDMFNLYYDGGARITFIDGLDGNCVDLDQSAGDEYGFFKIGKTKHSEAVNGLDTLGSTFSFEAVFLTRRDDYDKGYVTLFDYEDSASSSGFRITIDTDSTNGLHPEFRLYNGSSYSTLKSDTEVDVDMWYHLLCTFDGNSTMKIYLNGELDGTLDIPATYVPNNKTPADDIYVVGGDSDSDKNLDGRVDNIALFNTCLTGTEALSRANSFIGGKELYVENTSTGNNGEPIEVDTEVILTELEAIEGDSYITLNWTNPKDDYMEYDYVTITYGDEEITTSSSSYTVRDLSNGTNYDFTVVAYCTIENTKYSSLPSTTSATPVAGTYSYIENTYFTVDSLKDALSDASPGQTFILANGTYTGESLGSISSINGTEEYPVIIKAETVGGVNMVLDSTITIKNSAYVTLQGFNFTREDDLATMMKIVSSYKTSILDNIFDEEFKTSSSKTIALSTYSGPCTGTEFAYNIVRNKKTTGGFITTYYDEDTDSIADEMFIHHNLFQNFEPEMDPVTGEYTGDSDRESIIFGDSDSKDVETNHIVEYNLFDDCDGENEIITNKTSKNIYRYNTFRNCFGDLSIRFGDNHQVYGNIFYGDDNTNTWEGAANTETGGIRLYGSNHLVYNNYFYNLTAELSTHRMPLVIDGGEGNHYKVQNSYIAFNTIIDCYYGMGVGMNYNSDPLNNIIEYNVISNTNTEAIIVENGDDSNTWNSNIIDSDASISDILSGRSIATNSEITLELQDDIYICTNESITTAPDRNIYGNVNNLVKLEPSQVGPRD